ncbi:hypothetical protein GBN26_12280 [Plesiomonas shigelloides]|uniref:YciC family protein n=1 Tax=Plesiomonas shigelloides TaxID=703 RepID=UPI00126296B4|nr:YciC family protein [Plesiomonas shigelloides]KAB7699022.1 hypothetical protein GBN26_12280 [Plesiomonas shigelloides]
MPITAQTLLRDSANFIRNHLNTVLLLSLIVAVIVVLAEYLMIGTPDSIELSQDQIMMQSMRTQTLLNILTTPLFSVSLLSLVLLSSRGFQANTMTALKAGVPLYFSMLGLEVLSGLATFVGFLALILPGIYVAIRLSFAPCFLVSERLHMLDAMKASWAGATPWMRLVLQGYLFIYLGLRLPSVYILGLMDNALNLHPSLFALLVSVVYNLTSALMLIFLFRLYMLKLAPQQEQASTPSVE